MAPDYIYEQAVLEVSRWQRQALERKMIDVDTVCAIAVYLDEHGAPVSLVNEAYDYSGYSLGACEANYPVPARIIEWDFWPAEDSWNGMPTLYGFDHYKPGCWFQFVAVNEEPI